MDRFGRHPRFERLSEYADGMLSGAIADRVSAHLESCAACRREVATVREMDAALGDVPVPALPDDLFDRIVQRREADVRTLLPEAPVHMPRRMPRRRPGKSIVAAASLLAVASFAGLVLTNREATAGASHLRVSSASASSIPVDYRPGAALVDEQLVRVRATIWSADPFAESYTADVGVLSRSEDEFAGTIQLPPGAAYALLAVESLDGRTVDPNGGSFWEYPSNATAPAVVARARLDALREMRQWGVALATPLLTEAIAATERFPDEVALWNARAQYELGPAADATDRAASGAHRSRLEAFASRALDVSTPAERLADIARYAATLGALDVRRRIVERLAALDPGHPVVVEDRVREAMTAAGADLASRLEEAFRAEADTDGLVASVGYDVALGSGNPTLILRWADRLASLGPPLADATAMDLTDIPDLRVEGIERIRRRLAFYQRPPETLRPLHRTREEWESELRRRRAALRAALGQALLAEGEGPAGLAALRSSIGERWDPAVASALVRVAPRPLDDDVADLATLVRADPTMSEPFTPADEPSLEEIRAARRELIDRIVAGARTAEVPDAALRSRVGVRVPLDGGGVTLIALWQSPPATDDREVDALISHAAPLTRAGVRMLVAGPERWLDDLVEIADLAGARAAVDPDGEVTAGLGGWALWEYVIVHDGWYSVHHDLDEAARLALLNSEIR